MYGSNWGQTVTATDGWAIALSTDFGLPNRHRKKSFQVLATCDRAKPNSLLNKAVFIAYNEEFEMF